MPRPPLTVAAVCVFAALSTGHALAAPDLDWFTSIDSVGSTTIADTVTSSAGATFVVSTVTDQDIFFTVTRIDIDGTVAWNQSFSGPEGQDEAEAITLSPDEANVYVLARSSRGGSGSDYGIFKYDALTGQELWTRFVDGGDGGIDSPSDIASTPDGGAVATGGFDTPDEQRDFGTVRLDADGNVLWTRLYTGFGQFLFENDDAELIAVAPNGDVVISGNAMSGSDSDIVTLRYDGLTGATRWEAAYEGVNNDVATDLQFTPTGDVVMLGLDSLTSGPRWVLASYDGQSGTQRWSLVLEIGPDTAARDLAVAADGTVFATGIVDRDFVDSNSNDDLVAIALDGATGTVRWRIDFGDGGEGDGDFGSRIYPDGRGAVWVIGGTSSASLVPTPGDDDGLLLELDAVTGSVRSATTLDTTPPGGIYREALRHAGIDANGRLYVLGAVTGDTLASLAARYTLNDCPADLAPPFAVLDRMDVRRFVVALRSEDPLADLDGNGEVNSADRQAFVASFTAGCPAPQ